MRLRSGYPEIVACTLTWGTIGPIVRNIGLPASAIAFFRVLLGALVVLAWLATKRRISSVRPRARFPLLVAWGVTLAAHWTLLFEAFKRLDVATTILIVFFAPVLMAAGAPAVLGERLRPAALAALGVAVGGIVLITVPNIGRVDGAGLAFAMGSALLFAVLVLVGKLLTPHYDPAPLVTWQLGIAAIAMSPALARVSLHEVGRALPLLLLLGLVHTGVLGIAYMRAIRALEAQKLGVLFYLEPASAILYAWAMLSERPSAATLAGGALIVAAGMAIILAERPPAAPAGLPEPVPAAGGMSG